MNVSLANIPHTNPAWWITCHAFLAATWKKDGWHVREEHKQAGQEKIIIMGKFQVWISRRWLANGKWLENVIVLSSKIKNLKETTLDQTPSKGIYQHPTVVKLMHNLQIWPRARPYRRTTQRLQKRVKIKNSFGLCKVKPLRFEALLIATSAVIYLNSNKALHLYRINLSTKKEMEASVLTNYIHL